MNFTPEAVGEFLGEIMRIIVFIVGFYIFLKLVHKSNRSTVIKKSPVILKTNRDLVEKADQHLETACRIAKYFHYDEAHSIELTPTKTFKRFNVGEKVIGYRVAIKYKFKFPMSHYFEESYPGWVAKSVSGLSAWTSIEKDFNNAVIMDWTTFEEDVYKILESRYHHLAIDNKTKSVDKHCYPNVERCIVAFSVSDYDWHFIGEEVK